MTEPVDEGPFQNITSVVTITGSSTTYHDVVDVDCLVFATDCDQPVEAWCPLDKHDPIEEGFYYIITPSVWVSSRSYPLAILSKTGDPLLWISYPGCTGPTYYDSGLVYRTGSLQWNYYLGAINLCSRRRIAGFPRYKKIPNQNAYECLDLDGVTGLGLMLSDAVWEIDSTSSVTNTITLEDEHTLNGASTIQVIGQGLNDGLYNIHSSTTTTITVSNLVVSQGGGYVVYPAETSVTGIYSAVAEPSYGLYPPRATVSGDLLSATGTADQTLKLTNAGSYNGTQPITLLTATGGLQTVKLNTATYQGTATGNWENHAVQLKSSDSISIDTIRIKGTPNDYDGTYDPADYSIESHGLTLFGVFFTATATGTIEYEGISFTVTNLPTGYNKQVSVTVSGTTSYNGSYTAQALAAFGLIYAYDLNDEFFAGDETGNYSITSPDTISGSITSTIGTGPHTFTSGAKDKTGTVTEVDSLHSRVTVGGHKIGTGDDWEFLTGTTYAGITGEVVATNTATVDIDVPYDGTDAGTYRVAKTVK